MQPTAQARLGPCKPSRHRRFGEKNIRISSLQTWCPLRRLLVITRTPNQSQCIRTRKLQATNVWHCTRGTPCLPGRAQCRLNATYRYRCLKARVLWCKAGHCVALLARAGRPACTLCLLDKLTRSNLLSLSKWRHVKMLSKLRTYAIHAPAWGPGPCQRTESVVQELALTP